jgi:four helix bundle protein
VGLRRAATSVPLNIAEGCGCATKRELVRFLGYSYRSLKELTTCLELCARLYRTSEPAAIPLIDEADQLARMIRSFMRRLDVTAVVAGTVADDPAVAAAVTVDSLITQNS